MNPQPGLLRHLELGLSTVDAESRAAVGLEQDAADSLVAAKLIVEAARETPPPKLGMPRVEGEASAPYETAPADASFLGRLGPKGQNVFAIDDVRTLLLIARAGTLPHRRGAIERLRTLLEGGLPAESVRTISERLTVLRDEEVAYEILRARAALGGSEGRRARAEVDEWQKSTSQLAQAIPAFWERESASEPVMALLGDERAAVLLRCRDLPDVVLDHLSALVEGTDGVLSSADRLSLLRSLRHASDARLVPALIVALSDSDAEIQVEAARALGRISDPRTHAPLRALYDRTVVDTQRAMLAGALGCAGDSVGVSYARAALSSEDPNVLVAALEALELVGAGSDTPRLLELLSSPHPLVLRHAVRALARVGDSRALSALRALRDQTSVSAVWGEIEEAFFALEARLELLGEDTTDAVLTQSPLAKPLVVRDRPGARFRGFRSFVLGRLWLLLGSETRAFARLEQAALHRPRWTAPLALMATRQARRGRHAQALSLFRRAIQADRVAIERQPRLLKVLVKTFLRRAGEVAEEGRRDVAAGLVLEVTALDLRRADPALRLEVERMQASPGTARS